MIKANRKGFTLVELLVTIVLLGIVGAIVIYNMSSVTTSTKEKQYAEFIAKVKSSASVYADNYPEAFNELYVSRAFIYIKVDDVVSKGYLDEDEINPYTNERISRDDLIKASLDTTNGAVTFTYPLDDEVLDEQGLVAFSDYVVYGEPYDCMRGAGSYELALSDEDGNLIDLTEDNIKKYNFKCDMPSEFKDEIAELEKNSDDKDSRTCTEGKCFGLSTVKAGNYEIKYTWITDAGVKKSGTRILRVLAKAIPTFETNVKDYDFSTAEDGNPYSEVKFKKCGNGNCDDNNFYQTKLADLETNTWNVLTYKPYIEGADKSTTSFQIKKRINDPYVADTYEPVTDGFIDDFSFTRQADDGDKTYEITAKVVGHYFKDYSYQAVGYGRFKAELVIPPEYITATSLKTEDSTNNDDTAWNTQNTYKIDSDLGTNQSPIGIVKYEYFLSESDTLDKTPIKEDNVFIKTGKVTDKSLSLLGSGTCVDKAVEYKYIYFRAINSEGYVGRWARYDAKLTNRLDRIIEEYSFPEGDDGESHCKTDKKFNPNECHFTEKKVYVTYKSQLFNVLARYNENNEATVLLTLDTDTGRPVNPLDLRKGYASQKTCDGVFYKYYDYYVANDNINKEVKRWVNEYFPNDYKMMMPAIPNESSAIAVTYNSKLVDRYKNAAIGNPEYWLTDQFSYPMIVYLDMPRKHKNESTTVYNAYFYFMNGSTRTKQYAGKNSYVKPIVRFKDLYICGGDGLTDKTSFQVV